MLAQKATAPPAKRDAELGDEPLPLPLPPPPLPLPLGPVFDVVPVDEPTKSLPPSVCVESDPGAFARTDWSKAN